MQHKVDLLDPEQQLLTSDPAVQDKNRLYQSRMVLNTSLRLDVTTARSCTGMW